MDYYKDRLITLVCHVCGSNNLIKRDDFFVCDSCDAKFKESETKGTFTEIDADIANAFLYLNIGAFDSAEEKFNYISKKYPDILVENPLAHEAVTFPFEGEQYLCIGFDCGYMTGSDKVVNIMEDEGLYGYSGICRLMDMLVEAYIGKANVQEMIKEAGLII